MEENISNSELPFCFQRGTDPRTATCRGKLQTKRCKLNQEINKELRLRAGAENLFKATTNRKLKDTVALELSFVNSNLQLLKEQLSELNSSVEIYQNSNYEPVIPMIPLGLKETKEVNFTDSFSDFILEHYSEDSSLYGEAIADITDTRQSARIPTRDFRGITLLFRYYNLLYFVERRFFPSDRSLGIYFEWFDSLTGVPSCQRTVAFEKACILFNLGAIYTQIGARQDRCSEKGLDTAVDNFLRAAGVFKHILETFTNAPSMDLKPQFLEILVNIMLSQARECLFEKLQLQIEQFTSLENIDHLHRDLSGECAQLFNEYNYIHSNILLCEINTYLPECWIGLVSLKAEYYKVLAHYYASKSIYQTTDGQTINNNNNIGINSKNSSKSNSLSDKSFFIDFDENELDLFTVKRLHIRESLLALEETKRLQRMCRELKNKQTITNVLYAVHTNLKNEINELNLDGEKLIEQEFEMCDAPIKPSTKFTLASTIPDFISFKIEDPFKKLGPIAIFSARRHWTAPRSIRLQKGTHIDLMNGGRKSKLINCECKMSTFSKECELCQRYTTSKVEYESPESFGFQVRGDAPVIVSNVESNSLADLGGMKEGDFIVEISGIDVKWYSHQQILNLVQCNGPSLDLKVITPMDRNYLKPLALSKSLNSSDSTPCLFSPISTPSSTPDISPKMKAHRKLSKTKLLENVSCGGWNPFKRTNSLGKIF